MLIENGTIEIKIKTEGGINQETGYPIKPSESWGTPIECQFRATKKDLQARSNGEPYIQASYEILIEEQPYKAEQIRLTDALGNEKGEFSVIQIEPLLAVGKIRLWV